MRVTFPDGFIWGTAASAHQAEGGHTADDWWDFEHEPGRIADGQASTGNGFAQHYAEDFAAFAALGLPHHRLSVDWARVEPTEGRIDPVGLDHYRRVVDAALAAGAEPWVNLHHFVNPRWFAAKGAFLREENLDHWRRYVETVATALVPRGVRHWHTMNEPLAYSGASYLGAMFPPCHSDMGEFRAVTTNLFRAHAVGYAALKEAGAETVATIHALTEAVPLDPDDPADAGLADLVDTVQNRLPIEAHTTGVLPWPDAPVEIPGLAGSADLFGANWYHAVSVDSRRPFEYASYVPPGEGRRTQLGNAPWAEGLYRVLLRLRDADVGVPLLVAENGIGTDDDAWRIEFLAAHLQAVGLAVAAGADVRGYFHWTSVDNFEWVHGYTARFGLVGFDPATGERHPKPSAAWLGGVARAGALVVDEAGGPRAG